MIDPCFPVYQIIDACRCHIIHFAKPALAAFTNGVEMSDCCHIATGQLGHTTPSRVLGRGNHFEMIWIYAKRVLTQVINLIAVLYRSLMQLKIIAMGRKIVDDAITTIGSTFLPNPAPGLFVNSVMAYRKRPVLTRVMAMDKSSMLTSVNGSGLPAAAFAKFSFHVVEIYHFQRRIS